METLIFRRVFQAAITLFLVSLIIFLAVEVLPGDVARRILGRDASPASLEQLREQLHLNDPLIDRYQSWLTGVAQLDLGVSVANRKPVWDIVAPRLQVTALLSLAALVIYIPLVLLVAMIQAVNRDRPIDHILTVATIFVLSTPEFLLATLLLLAFGVALSWFPVASILFTGMSTLDFLRALVLPSVTLALIMAAYAVRMLRDNLIETLDSDFVTMAEFKGLSRTRILLRHVLPNALAPTLNVTALNLSYLIGGVVIVERVFVFPGFGSLLIDSLQLRDVPLIEACVLIAATIYIMSNLMADLLSIWLNPRLRP